MRIAGKGIEVIVKIVNYKILPSQAIYPMAGKTNSLLDYKLVMDTIVLIRFLKESGFYPIAILIFPVVLPLMAMV